jgi:flagellar hook-associated protein 2
MASGITFSGFNNIDFTVVLNAIMTQESQPLSALQAQQRALQTTDSNYAALATKLSTLQSATDALSSATTFTKYSATSSDTTAVTASATSSATPGRYELAVTSLAHAQTSVSSSFAADVDTTLVATGGTLTIGGEGVTLSGPVTLQELAAAINANDDVPATASIVETSPGTFHLVLTGKETGEDHAFAVNVSGLTGASVAFADPNVVEARNAELTINGVHIESASNALASGIPGVTVTLLKESATTIVNVGQDDDDLVSRVNAFASAYNDLVKFASDQTAAANKGTAGTLGRDSLLKSLRGSLRNALVTLQGSGTYKNLAEVGIGFNRTGQITVNASALKEALAADTGAVRDLFTNTATGAFTSVGHILDEYTQSGGFVPDARARITDQISRIGKRSDDLAARLAVRRAALQREFIAADQAMSRLKSQQGALSSFSTNLISNAP